ncbi:hypothetical protein JN00_0200 [Metamycoplasma subdolum]|uniref:Uncharacterized protein n=1 Tax=Metamycoplasma subdolum TaxID=92407 RepID=A0A3M0A0B0_9BACT|nr:hypothetical protein [Metamycoplasma subdolum]RMA78561.1 hypothetical protein JN00_0200 [Metamycoplasma subdolum]WPB50300.1 hypothetical protein R9C05_01665 [Metamycoplasma subdolum]
MEQINEQISESLFKKRRFIESFCNYAKIEDSFRYKNNGEKRSGFLNHFVENLDNDAKTIFLENYIFKNRSGEWYLSHWSKGTYYKKLNDVTNLFMRFINEYY